MKTLYLLVQCTWGILQTAAGLCLYLKYRHCKHYWYHGALVTEWGNSASVSLGLFVFVTAAPLFRKAKESSRKLLVHEYGHTIQSLILGPAYLFVIGIPSSVWANAPRLARKRRECQIPYYRFFTERWANYLGEKVTKEMSLRDLMID